MATDGVRRLTLRQQRFVEAYLTTLNGEQAAIAAGYSPKTARFTASQTLTKRNVQEALAARQQELKTAADVTPERVIQEYARLAFADMADYVTWDGLAVHATPSAQLPQGATRAVAEVTETITDKGRTFRFKLHDKKGALDALAKHLGLFQDTNVIINQDNRSINVAVDMSAATDAELDGIIEKARAIQEAGRLVGAGDEKTHAFGPADQLFPPTNGIHP
jgi:phage terminase small subunit